MTNREWLMEQMQNMSDEELAHVMNGSVLGICEKCREMNGDAIVECSDCKTIWLKEEHKEKIELKQDERTILANLPDIFQYIKRNKAGSLMVFELEPKRNKEGVWETTGQRALMAVFNHLFKFVKPDGNVFSIKELLKEEVD